MLRQIARAFHLSEGAVVVPLDASAAPQARPRLLEQYFMDKIVAKRNLVRFMFVALVAAFFLRVVLG